MRDTTRTPLSILHGELELLEAETFEITDNLAMDEQMMPASTTTSTTSSCTSTSGTSCCN
jgi:thiazolylpeptide-type bacteriocin precursor